MNMFGIAFDSSSAGAAHAHDPVLVTLSFVVAALASYCSLDMAERLRASEGRTRNFWLLMAGVTLGGGIWSMHFIAMTAFSSTLERGYEPILTVASGVIAVLAVTAGLAALGRKPGWGRLAGAGAFVGMGVVIMHYMGMAAMQVQGTVAYRFEIFSISLLIALTAATVALWLAVNLQHTWQRACAALVMAVAICGMHYTGMAGTVLISHGAHEVAHTGVSKGMLAAIVASATGCFVLVAMVLAFIDRRLEARSVQEANRLRELNADLEQARREADAANRAKSAFLATMSHEIRTPMNAVVGMSHLLRDMPLTPQAHEYVSIISSAGDSLLTVLNDILDFSKIESGKLQMTEEPFDLLACVEESLELLGPLAANKNLALLCQFDTSTPRMVVGDAARLRQVLVNLVGNAVKFTSVGYVAVRVEEADRAGRKVIHIAVRDTGIGIPKDRLHRLFQSFSQVDASTTRQFGGTGLGLAISQRLARLMGGDIQVESQPGVGSLFYFDLPDRRVENATLGLAGEPLWKGKRVWLKVGPSALDETLGGYLTAWGMSVTRDAAEADFVVTDANTAIPMALAIKPALRFGEGKALSKPMRPTQLKAAIGRLLASVPVLEKKMSNQGAPMAVESPLRILVAEDNAVNQRVIQGLLRRLGYEPVIVENGLLALEAVRQMPYDLMLLDLHMPEMDGLDAARQVVATVPLESRPRMVALTANAFPEDRQACMDAGMQDFLSKPIQLAELRRALLDTARGAAA